MADEIRRFSEQRGKDHIIPILLDGIPNNEVKESDQAQGAFAEELLRVLPMPLAADYRGFDPQRDKFRKGTFSRMHGSRRSLTCMRTMASTAPPSSSVSGGGNCGACATSPSSAVRWRSR